MFTKEQIREICNIVAPTFGFDSGLVYAICLQESQKSKDGEFDPSMARLEQGFYRRYIAEKMQLATTSEVLLAASYGITQMMGESLRELGYFAWYFSQAPQGVQDVLRSPLSEFAIPNALDAYVMNLGWMVEWSCKWLAKKRDLAGGDIHKMLQMWNGGSNPDYADEVLAKCELVKKQ